MYIANCFIAIFNDKIYPKEVSLLEEWGEVNLRLDEYLKKNNISVLVYLEMLKYIINSY